MGQVNEPIKSRDKITSDELVAFLEHKLPYSSKACALKVSLIIGDVESHAQLKAKLLMGLDPIKISEAFSATELLNLFCLRESNPFVLEKGLIFSDIFPHFHVCFSTFLYECCYGTCLRSTEPLELRLCRLFLSQSTENIQLIFSTRRDGMSLKRILQMLQYFSGTLLFVISDLENVVQFGAMISCMEVNGSGWVMAMNANDCGLVQFLPELRFRRWRGRDTSKNFLSLSENGIGFGGQENFYRLFLDKDLKNFSCQINEDATFEPGSFITNEQGIVGCVDIYGLASEESLKVWEQKKNDEQQIRLERRKVQNKQELLESDFNKEFLFEKTFNREDKDRN